MSNLTLRLPDSLHQVVREMAEQEGVSINQFIACAASEKVSALRTLDDLRQRAQRANLKDFDRILDLVRDAVSDHGDEQLPKPRSVALPNNQGLKITWRKRPLALPSLSSERTLAPRSRLHSFHQRMVRPPHGSFKHTASRSFRTSRYFPANAGAFQVFVLSGEMRLSSVNSLGLRRMRATSPLSP